MNPSSAAMLVARALLRGPSTLEAITLRLRVFQGKKPSLVLTKLASQMIDLLGEGRRPRAHEIASVLESSGTFMAMVLRRPQAIFSQAGAAVTMQPAAGAPQQWALPVITSSATLATWLGLTPAALHWLVAPWRGDQEKGGTAQHYRYRWIPRRGGPPRLLEAPLPQLKSVQRQILREILNQIPAHPAAHGFVHDRSIVSFATPHQGQRCVLRMDVQDFFPSIRLARVVRVFLTAGYPETVAEMLAKLCTNVTPSAVRQIGTNNLPIAVAWPLRSQFRERHLPQGAPTSPALANLCAYALDLRLTGLARKFDAHYTRYADDLLFSGGENFRRDAHRCQAQVGGILLMEGLVAAHRKTRLMPNSIRQQAAGLVLNVRPNLPRQERDTLKAILTNCRRHGPASQNRSQHADFRAHLQGRIAHARHVNPLSGAKLQRLFDEIDWS